MNRLKGFTMLELLISMLLLSVLVAMGYQAMGLFSRSTASYRENTGQTEELFQLAALLKADVMLASDLTLHPHGFLARMPEHEVIYRIDDEQVIRIQMARTDTFLFDEVNMRVFFEGQPVSAFDALIDRVEIITEVHEQAVPYVYQKTYAAEQLMTYGY